MSKAQYTPEQLSEFADREFLTPLERKQRAAVRWRKPMPWVYDARLFSSSPLADVSISGLTKRYWKRVADFE